MTHSSLRTRRRSRQPTKDVSQLPAVVYGLVVSSRDAEQQRRATKTRVGEFYNPSIDVEFLVNVAGHRYGNRRGDWNQTLKKTWVSEPDLVT